MKTTQFVLAALLFTAAASCDDRKDNKMNDDNYTTTGSTAGRDVVAPADNTSTFRSEMEEYRVRLNKRIEELDNEIEEKRRERKIEKQKEKIEDLDNEIREREGRRNDVKDRLERLEDQTEEGWADFKREMEDVFEEVGD